MTEPIISVAHVSKHFEIYSSSQDRLKQMIFRGNKQYYREFWALRDINLDIYKGETVGIVGRNGSGKSTLLQIIAGTLLPTSGKVTVNGKVAALLELGSGFNMQYTGKENVYLNGAIWGLNESQIDKLYDEIVDFSEIGDFMNQPISTYSSGMIVRLAFAVQAVIPKDVLIVDEALAVGDELFQRKCYAKIEQFKKSGGTILYVSHSGASVIELCDRAMLLDSGEQIIIGKSKSVVSLYHKLLYASPERKQQVRDDIIRQVSELDNELEEEVIDTVLIQEDQVSASEDNICSELEDYFDAGLLDNIRPVEYDEDGAKIFEAGIYNEEGAQVNVLASGQPYLFKYKVKFEKKHHNVRFGFLIKTMNGFGLGGAASAKYGKQINQVNSGSEIKVEFRFVPRLNTGIYFLNGGVLADSNKGETFIHRVIDISAFRIRVNEEALFTEYVDFEVESKVFE
ncbi:ABC transporter ATP-binding protein [Paenibacillus sp. KS-LC4]|uniref:ABC transporter ATP-binding protein n=1 Tax=Paenibacillus sp. KS-LC4 TaxID=2979727 RepID=UPI0030CF7618